ncbi:hypothetical protein L9F63_009756, partial [Diploptera punctata]
TFDSLSYILFSFDIINNLIAELENFLLSWLLFSEIISPKFRVMTFRLTEACENLQQLASSLVKSGVVSFMTDSPELESFAHSSCGIKCWSECYAFPVHSSGDGDLLGVRIRLGICVTVIFTVVSSQYKPHTISPIDIMESAIIFVPPFRLYVLMVFTGGNYLVVLYGGEGDS